MPQTHETACSMPSTSRSLRQSNIELLRIIAAVGVIVLHYNNTKIGGAFSSVDPGSASSYTLYFLEALFLASVDLFMMILGRFQSGKKEAGVSKIVSLLIQVSIIHIAFYLIAVAATPKTFSFAKLGAKALPSNYFIITYCVVFALSPYVNKLLEVIKSKRLFIILLLFFFSIFPTVLVLLNDATGISIKTLHTISYYGADKGYTFVNYMLMYIIGAISKDLKLKKRTSALGFLCCLIPLFILETCSRLSLPHPSNLHSYTNPLIIGCAFFALMFFSSVDIGKKKWINTIAAGSLMVYLTHEHLFPLFNIKYYASQGIWIMLLNLIITCVLCYLAGWLISVIYGFLMKPFLRFLSRKLTKYKIVIS